MPHRASTQPAAIVQTDSMRKVGTTRNLLSLERSMTNLKEPPFFGTTKSLEKKRGRENSTLLMTRRDRRLGMKFRMWGRWLPLETELGGGCRASGGVVWKWRRRPLDMISAATGSPRDSQASWRSLPRICRDLIGAQCAQRVIFWYKSSFFNIWALTDH